MQMMRNYSHDIKDANDEKYYIRVTEMTGSSHLWHGRHLHEAQKCPISFSSFPLRFLSIQYCETEEQQIACF